MPVQVDALVITNEQRGPNLYEMEMVVPEIAATGQAGQFVHIKLGQKNEPLLRRPISLFDVDPATGRITLLYKVVGAGTQLLAGLRGSDYIDVMGPLGKGFHLPAPQSRVVLVGGGIGIAPLLYLARVLLDQKCRVQVFYGADHQRQLVAMEKFQQLDVEVKPATIDGSLGYRGLVADYLAEALMPSEVDFIYTCGPELMMAQVVEYGKKHGIPGEVSLEEYMACGIGACLGCARKLKTEDDYYIKICKDGPVFPLAEVEFPLHQVV